jgi:hypothetical protein
MKLAALGLDEPVSASPGAPAGATDVSARLEALEELRRRDQITVDEYEEQRDRILGTL